MLCVSVSRKNKQGRKPYFNNLGQAFGLDEFLLVALFNLLYY